MLLFSFRDMAVFQEPETRPSEKVAPHLLGAALVFIAVVLLALELEARRSPAQAEVAGDRPSFVPELGVPAREVVAFGASPAEAPGEAWAYGFLGAVPPAADPTQADRYTLLRHTDADGWQPIRLPGEAALAAKGGFPARLGALGGQATPAGSLALLTNAGIVMRNPGAAPVLVPPPAAGDPELLGDRESLPPDPPPGEDPTPYAVVDGAGGLAGLFIAPYIRGAPRPEGDLPPGVLHHDGRAWSREAIEGPPEESLRPLAIGCGPTGERPNAASSDNCWLLARLGGGQLGLFRREPGEDGAVFAWAPVAVDGGLLGGQPESPPPDAGSVSLAPLRGNAQMLTVTSQGIWVDFLATLDGSEPRSASELVAPTPNGARVLGSWCFPVVPGCEGALGASLPGAYRSFAWPGAGEEPGARLITGLADRAMLELAEGSFVYSAGAGGSPGSAPGGAAFLAPDRGFVADGADPAAARDGAGQSQVFALTPEPVAAQLAPEPVPFRHPLLAVAAPPGAGATGEAMAVGLQGQAARFVPGEGWRQYPTLIDTELPETGPVDFRDVAWPSGDRAYAVGEDGAIWVWERSVDSWRPEVQQIADFQSVAFSSVDPSRGFAFGGPVLGTFAGGWRFGTYSSDLIQAGVAEATTVAFAANEALAGFRSSDPSIEGGLIVEDGGGWRVDEGFAALLRSLPPSVETVPTEVAGLPDGGAVVAGPGWVIKRESPSAPWALSAQPLPEARAVAALAAHRDPGGEVRAVVSIGLGPSQPQVPYLPPEAPPPSGYVLRETDSGWTDMQHQALAVQTDSAEMPVRPEPVLDLLIDPSGEQGLAVGGQSGNLTGSGAQPSAPTVGPPANGRYETAAALRFPPETVHDPNEPDPLDATAGSNPLFAVVGHAACVSPCAAQAGAGLGPDVSLSRALEKASAIGARSPENLRAVLYTGGRLETEMDPGESATAEGIEAAEAYERELLRLAGLFAGSGPLPLLTAASPDLMRAGPSLFSSIFAPFGPSEGSAYYAYRSESPGRAPVSVIVLDYSAGVLGQLQEDWLREQLFAAKEEGVASVVVGGAALDSPAEPPAAGAAPAPRAEDAEAVRSILFEGGASAYFYDHPGANVVDWMTSGELRIPAYGTGALGYVPPRGASRDWLGSTSLLLFELASAPGLVGSVFPSSAKAIPVIESLTMRSEAGLRLATGQAAQFEALGRRAPGGVRIDEENGRPVFAGPEPYETLPFASTELQCHGVSCARAVPVDFAFASSNPEVADFVARAGEAEDPAGRPLRDPRSGLLCARSPGTTTISVSAGELSYSRQVTVTAESIVPSCWEGGTAPAQPPVPSEAQQPPSPEPAPRPEPPPVPSEPSGSAPQAPGPVPEPATPSAPAPPLASPAPTPSPTATPGIVLPPAPVLLQPPAPPTGVSAVNAPSPASAPSPTSAPSPASAPSPTVQGAVSPAERREIEAAVDLSHQARAHRLTSSPTTQVASPPRAPAGHTALLPLLALVGALGAASALTSGAARRSSRVHGEM
jgi:hypothetical protein